jgi:hypothetical protein
MNNEEILNEVKKIINGATVVSVLWSGDINIIVPDEAIRDRARYLPLTEYLKIFRKDYLVEVLSVPLSVEVNYEKGVDNSCLVTLIYDTSRIMALGL